MQCRRYYKSRGLAMERDNNRGAKYSDLVRWISHLLSIYQINTIAENLISLSYNKVKIIIRLLIIIYISIITFIC